MQMQRCVHGRCRLCLAEGPLCNSHVIPEFLYKPLYDEKHRLTVFDAELGELSRKPQKGTREYLLCDSCETKLSQHERYVQRLLSGKLNIQSVVYDHWVTLSGLDYEAVRLFGLSVLWRASVSSRPGFHRVLLGPHEEPIRRMIHAGDPGQPDQYPFFLTLLTQEGADPGGIVSTPIQARPDGHRTYVFVFGGLLWAFVVSSHGAPRVVRALAITTNGDATVPISAVTNFRFIVQFFERAARRQRDDRNG